MILLLLLLTLNRAEAAEEDGDEGHDDQAPVGHHHPLRSGWHLPGSVHTLSSRLRVCHDDSLSRIETYVQFQSLELSKGKE